MPTKKKNKKTVETLIDDVPGATPGALVPLAMADVQLAALRLSLHCEELLMKITELEQFLGRAENGLFGESGAVAPHRPIQAMVLTPADGVLPRLYSQVSGSELAVEVASARIDSLHQALLEFCARLGLPTHNEAR